MLPATAHRVQQNTAESVNERIQTQTRARIARFSRADSQAIERRLAELDQEWDVERYLETMAPTFTLAGIALGLTVNKKWFAFPVLVQSFFLWHALEGWCPPLPILRRLGVRTEGEINEERNALQELQGNAFHD